MLECADPGWDPVALAAAIPCTEPLYLLETPGGPADLPRRTFLCWEPEREIFLRRGVLEMHDRRGRVRCARCSDPLAALRAFLHAEGAHHVPYSDGFSGGLVGYVSYDFKNYLERLPDTVQDDLETPDLRFGLVRRVVSWDHRERRLRLRVSWRCRSTRAATDLTRARAALHDLFDELQSWWNAAAKRETPASRVQRERTESTPTGALRSNLDRTAYDSMLARAREFIYAGDIYQANLSHRFEAPFSGSGTALYRRLRAINPSPFAVYMRFPDQELVSCSPERLVCLQRGRVETRPIAGTRPRGATTRHDRSLEQELLSNEKERAEHLMIVDMARNDIGRVCELGSVHVEHFMRVERYSHVHHLVSNVAGTLRGDCDGLDLLAATFPGASITGVPKIRCMQIIDELELVRPAVSSRTPTPARSTGRPSPRVARSWKLSTRAATAVRAQGGAECLTARTSS
jgi:anthranilate/para-aminobenzoate synthase component I